MSREAKAVMKLKEAGRHYEVNVRLRGEVGVVRLEFDRTDLQQSPFVRLPLDEARVLLRQLQAACDQAHHLAKVEHAQQRAAREMAAAERRLTRILDRIADAETHS